MQSSLWPVQVADLAIELGYPSDLEPFSSLHFAAEDLLQAEMQWYWPDATRENIDQIVREEAQRFVSSHAG